MVNWRSSGPQTSALRYLLCGNYSKLTVHVLSDSANYVRILHSWVCPLFHSLALYAALFGASASIGTLHSFEIRSGLISERYVRPRRRRVASERSMSRSFASSASLNPDAAMNSATLLNFLSSVDFRISKGSVVDEIAHCKHFFCDLHQ